MLLFLDIDGVLHAEPIVPGQELAHLPTLEAILREFPAVKIVISSNWRVKQGFTELQAIFSADIAHRVLGVTPILTGYASWPYTRQSEIVEWLRANELAHSAWIALDDKPHLFRPFCRNLIVCQTQTGLDDGVVKYLRERFANSASATYSSRCDIALGDNAGLGRERDHIS